MGERYPVGILKDEFGNPVGLREFPEGDTLPKSILPDLGASDVGADPAGTAQALVTALSQNVDDALDTKVDKVSGKQLSTEDFTTDEKDKLSNLQPWATAPTQDAAQTALGMSASGKAVATGTAAQGRTALGLGTAATANVTTSATDTTAGRLLRVGDGGLLGIGVALADANAVGSATVFTRGPGAAATNYPGAGGSNTAFGAGLVIARDSSVRIQLVGFGVSTADSIDVYVRGANAPGDFTTTFRKLYHTGNTTIDSNGFIKSASPILKLHSDRVETEIEAPHFERLGTGHYRITGCNGLRLTDGWYIETPHDRNGNKYFNIEWEQDHEPDAESGVLDEPADVTLTIRCYERVWNPATGQHENGDPVDIPEGRWIDLRMNEVRQPEPEMPEGATEPEQPVDPESTEPYIPSVVTMAQAKLALLYAGLYEQAEAFINDLPEPQKSAALIEWNHRQTLERDHPLVGQVATALELTEQQLDGLFLDASLR